MSYNSSTRSLLRLPPEIWIMISEPLGLQDKKQSRLVNREWRGIATPLCFKTLTFDMNDESVLNLAAIARHKHLACHVRTLVLQRRERFRRFADYEEWLNSIRLPGDPNSHTFTFDDTAGDDDIMSYQEWLQYTDTEKENMFDQYEDDRMAFNDSIQSIAENSCLLRIGCDFGETMDFARLSSSEYEENNMIVILNMAISNMKQLTTFNHKPSFLLDNRWVTHWGRLRIYSYQFNQSFEADFEEDHDIEALHLSYVLQAIGSSRQALVNLRSMAFHVDGPAFWGSACLQRLWKGEGHQELIRLRELFEDAEEAEEHLEPTSPDRRHDDYVRQLVMMENSIRDLTNLDCSVSEDEEHGGLYWVAKPLFEFLCCGTNLENVRLAFGCQIDGVIQSDKLTEGARDGPRELLNLLEAYPPWSKIKRLRLEMNTDEKSLVRFLLSLRHTLRHLTLSNVLFQPSEGSWHSALPAIAKGLEYLETLDLSDLCDYTQDGHPQAYFDDGDECWVGKSACYPMYKEAAIEYLLRTKDLPVIDAELYLKNHKQDCKHAYPTVGGRSLRSSGRVISP